MGMHIQRLKKSKIWGVTSHEFDHPLSQGEKQGGKPSGRIAGE